MPLSRDFDETAKGRARRDPEFRARLLQEAVGALLRGEVEVGKALAADASVTVAELLQRLEDEADIEVLRERLADDDVAAYVLHIHVAADVSA